MQFSPVSYARPRIIYRMYLLLGLLLQSSWGISLGFRPFRFSSCTPIKQHSKFKFDLETADEEPLSGYTTELSFLSSKLLTFILSATLIP